MRISDNADRLIYALRNLPSRKPRGSPENIVRQRMYCWMMAGKSRREAEKLCLEALQKAGVDCSNLELEYGNEAD